MGKPGAKKMDQIVSVTPGDVHIIMVPSPGGPVPTPIPHPCASMIKDKVATKVKVMGQPGAVKGSKSKHTPPHIPMGPGPFQKPPKNEGKIITGSSNVFYEGKEAAMLGDTGQMCSDPSDTPVGKVIGTAATVLIGGGGSGGDEAREKASTAAMKAASAACHKWISANMPPGAEREQAHRDVCTATGHPIDVATGKVFTRAVEVVLKGRIPLEISRNYSSARSDGGPLGNSWRHSWQIELVLNEEFVALRDENGRFIPFAPVKEGQTAFGAIGRLTLDRDAAGGYAVRFKDGRRYLFDLPREGRGKTIGLSLVAVEDAFGNRAQLRYDGAGRLAAITDTANRVVQFIYHADGRLAELRLQETARSPEKTVRRYHYNDVGLLVAAEDAVGGRWTYEYAGHLLTRETNRNGDSFYFRYDSAGWCVETWGDGGLLHRWLDYDRSRRRTLVTNGPGYRRLYEWSEQGVVVNETDHEGHLRHFDYNEFIECVAEVDALGHKWTYEYDKTGRLVAIESPDGVAATYKWDELGRLVEKIDRNGGKWSWTYDGAGQTVTRWDPLGHQTIESRNQLGDLVRIRAADGREVRFSYDAAGNCSEMINGDGLRLTRVFTALGDLLRESDQYGTRFETGYDPHGYPEFVRLRGRGESHFERDAEGRITRMTTSRGRCFEYAYMPFLGKVTRMRQTSGVTLADASRITPDRLYTYDTEARLVVLEIDSDRVVEFTYGEHGQPTGIRYGDGREQLFERDPRGGVRRFLENGELVFAQEGDAVGRVVRRLTGDGEEFVFDYDNMGNLVAGSGSGDTASFEVERDPLGRIVAQRGAAGEFDFEYDEIGMCTGYRCGQDLAIGFNSSRIEEPGATLEISVNGRAEVDLAFDARERLTSAAFFEGDRHEYRYGNRYSPSERRIIRDGRDHMVEQFVYDPAGLPVRRETQDGSAQLWERDDRDRLVGARDEHSGVATAEDQAWGYDAYGDRVLTTTSTGARHHVAYEGHRPLRCAGQLLTYDRRGRLASRADADGRVTRFHWNSLSQLRRVELPDGKTIAYNYDVFGRRVSKERGTEVDRFLWIDNHLVHERTSSGRERHYLYQPGTFAPLACLIRGDRGSWCSNAITTDWRGAPITVTAPGGRDVWQAVVSPWGERQVLHADVAMPLTLPGQYEDVETGLSYNNARYYNPTTATYISPDPIGLAGGDNCYQYVADPLSQIDPLGLNPENIALGKTSKKTVLPDGTAGKEYGVLSRFKADPLGDGSVTASSWNDFDKVTDAYGLEDNEKIIGNAIRDAKAIHFNLEGLDENVVREILNDPDPKKQTPPYTRWELSIVLNDPELRNKTTFYDGPGVVSKLIPCG